MTIVTPALPVAANADSPLKQGNSAMRADKPEQAIRHYMEALAAMPGLSKTIAPNLALARQKYRAQRMKVGKPHVAVCGWELSHNAAGRAYTLAMLYETFAEVEIIGSHFPGWGCEVWEPLRDTAITKHSFVVKDEAKFVSEAIQLVAAHPYDIVHLSKPRAPNIFFGILYKLIWDAKVLMDIDDEELAFVVAETPISVDDYLKQHGQLPDLKDLAGKDWTRLAVGLAKEFDGITVCNAALQQRYGGEIIRHARDERLFALAPESKRKNRTKFGISHTKKVVLFFGTPRQHKGLEQIADAIANLKRDDLLFVIVGDFLDGSLKTRLQAKKDVEYVFVGNQSFDAIGDIAAIGDFCILPHQIDTFVSQYQTPAKLIDAMAAGLTIIVGDLPAIEDIISAGAVVRIVGNLTLTMKSVLSNEIDLTTIQTAARNFFKAEMTVTVNAKKLEQILCKQKSGEYEVNQELVTTISHVLRKRRWPISEIARSYANIISPDAKYTSGIRVPTVVTAPLTAVNKQSAVPLLQAAAFKKLPISVLIITWDIGHNPLGRSYMLAEVVQRVARHTVLVGFQFPRYGDDIWEPVRRGQVPVISLPGSNLPEFHNSLQNIAERIKPDIVIACKLRLPSVELGLMIKERWGCPLIIDVDDHELSFFKNQTELQLEELAAMPTGVAARDVEPYSEIWTRLTQSLYKSADEIIVSNVALQSKFGGTIVPHVRDESAFDPTRYNSVEVRRRFGVPVAAKVVMFFGTPRAHKGVGTLAKAIGQMADTSFLLLIIGAATDRSVTAKLDTLAPNRIIYLPNQPFSAIPEILSMADVVCLPQDETHAISQYQLPAKAIDAVAMGVPLLVSNTPPLMQLVKDQVAELVAVEDIPEALLRLCRDVGNVEQARSILRSRFLARYSYAAAAVQLKEIFQRSMSRKRRVPSQGISRLVDVSRNALGQVDESTPKKQRVGVDIVVFWKQNDTGLYGRRHDMVIKYLASRPDVRKVVVLDAPISEHDLSKLSNSNGEVSQDRNVFICTYEKLLGANNTDRISYNVFIYPPGKYRYSDDGTAREDLFEGYRKYLEDVFVREDVRASESVFWIYPKNYFAPQLIRHFKPARVAVDIVDDHRSWPGVSPTERDRLTVNYRDTLAHADVAFANCLPVQRSMQEFHARIQLVPNGCDSSPPQDMPKNNSEYATFCEWPGKTIGFIGNLEAKIDIELLGKLSEHFDTCQIVLIGSTHANPAALQLKRFPNVRMLGVVPYRQAGAWVSRFDVGLVPHLTMDLTRNMNPLKVFAYLTQNVPVVSTEIENIERNSELVHVAPNHDAFISCVERILRHGRPQAKIFLDYVAINSWGARLSNCVDELIRQMVVPS